MEPQFKHVLPPALQRLVDEIETAAGAPIEVEENAAVEGARAISAFTETHMTPALQFQHGILGTTRTLPLPGAVAAHELLHLHRTFVEGVPSVQIDGISEVDAATGGEMDAQTRFGSTLEHLIIEPRLPQYGFSTDYTPMVREFWTGFPQSQWKTPADARWFGLLRWLETDFLSANIGAKERAASKLRRAGLFDDARELSNRMRLVVESGCKEGMVLIAAGFLHVPLENITLSYPPRPDRPGYQIRMSEWVKEPQRLAPGLEIRPRGFGPPAA